MTPDQITLIQQSWGKLRPGTDEVARLFYGRLFAIEPSLRTLFQGDMAEQRRKLMTMLSIVVASLDRLEMLLPAVDALGARHAGYGVTEAHYATVGNALVWTLHRGLGAAFTDEVKQAWLEAYGLLAERMKGAAAKAPQPASIS